MLAIPHDLVIALFVGGATYIGWQSGESTFQPGNWAPLVHRQSRCFGVGLDVSPRILGLARQRGTALTFDQTQRDSASYISSGSVGFETRSYAIVATGLQVDTDVPDWLQVRSMIGDIRLHSTPRQRWPRHRADTNHHIAVPPWVAIPST